MNVDIQIDTVVLHGFEQRDTQQILAVVERELARLLAEEGVPTALRQPRAVARLDGGTFEVARNARAEAIGLQVARAVYGGLDRE